MGETVGRFAPTPSGRMHLGNLFSCLIAWLSVRSQGGRMILRQEDLDPQRTSPAFAAQVEEDLAFLGLDWDEGGTKGGPAGPYHQSRRGDFYESCLNRLAAMGLTYPCFCSRAELHAASAPHTADGDPIYPGTCRNLSPQEIEKKAQARPPAVRLKASGKILFTDRHYGPQAQDLATECGDFILRRWDGVFAYQLAVVADDGAMGVTEVVRGRDLLSSAPRQLYLYRLLALPEPVFRHVPLVLARDGRRLSKREQDVSLDRLKKRYRAQDIIGRLAWLAGQLDRPEPVAAKELIPVFRWEKVPKEDIFLPERLFESTQP